MLVLEDIETIVTPLTRSYFFNEVDGLGNNDGILMLASTNFLNRLDPGLSKRPSRFDRKYLFPLPNRHERELYAQYWRTKLEKNEELEFPKILCPAMAKITVDFSFAYMQEAFVATLLEIARLHTDDAVPSNDKDHDHLDRYLLWRVFKNEVESLHRDVDPRHWLSVEARYDIPDFGMALPEARCSTKLDNSAPNLPGSLDFHDSNSINSLPSRPTAISNMDPQSSMPGTVNHGNQVLDSWQPDFQL